MVLNDGPLGFTLNGKGFPATEPIVAKLGQTVRVRYMNEGLQIHPMHLHGLPQLVIAKDGFLLPDPHYEDTVLVAPGERVRRPDQGQRAGDLGLPLPHPHPRRERRRDVRHGHRADRAEVGHRGEAPAALHLAGRTAWHGAPVGEGAGRGQPRPRALAARRAGAECLARRGDRAGEPDGRDRHLVDLELRVSEQAPRIAFHKAAYVDVGPASGEPFGPIRIGISWRAAGLAPLFPVFSGTLAWDDDELRLEGYYAPPGGGIGIVADRLLLNVAARGTARLLLERIASAMRGEDG